MHLTQQAPGASPSPIRKPLSSLAVGAEAAQQQIPQSPAAGAPQPLEGWAPTVPMDEPKRSQLLESPEALQALRVLADGGAQPPAAAQVAQLAAQLRGQPAYQTLVQEGTDALVGRGAPPSPERWQAALLESGAAAAERPAAIRRAAVGNTTALVFLVMLEAQRAAMEEKRDSLRALKMHAGMLEDLNEWVARVLIPAQRSLNARVKEGHLKDTLHKRTKARTQQRQERIEETIGLPTEVDTQWGAIDEATGRVFIPGLRDAATQLTRIDAQDLATLIAQADQWRSTLQNNQTRQGLDFQRIDHAMNSTWNMLTAFLKASQDATNAIIRNGLG